MPPKKGKNEQKKKQKMIEDKTFGMKNKKGKKGQDAIKRIAAQVNGGATKAQRQRQLDNELKAKAKLERAREKEMMGKLFAPVQSKAKNGEDPASIICAFFKAGNCAKGAKCKFSHNLAVQRKGAKINAYQDRRDEEKEADKMEDWDQDKLNEVVKNKHGKQVVHPTTNIICKYFLDALENNKYGWFWVCPNDGDKCKYRHALPEGYILKKDRKKMEALKDQLTIEELVDQEREALGPNTTKVTLESFMAWKKKKLMEKKKAMKAAKKDKKDKIKQGQRGGVSALSDLTRRTTRALTMARGLTPRDAARPAIQLTGRDMFSLGAVDVDALDESGAADAVSQPSEAPAATGGESGDVAAGETAPEPQAFDASVFATKEVDLEEEEEEVAGSGDAPSEATASGSAPPVDEDLFGDDLGLEGLELED